MEINQNKLKQLAAIKAVDFVEDGMFLGLGTGSTVTFMVDALAQKLQDTRMKITCVTTSSRTSAQAVGLGIPVVDLNEVDHLDLTIDGADEIDKNFQGIKGGGAAHTMEKIVATASDKVIWIVDESKMVDTLGKFPLPVEVFDYGLTQVTNRLTAANLNPVLRKDEAGQPIRTHFKNLVLDLQLGQIKNPAELADFLDHEVGVVEHGLFLDMVNTVIVGKPAGPEVITNIR